MYPDHIFEYVRILALGYLSVILILLTPRPILRKIGSKIPPSLISIFHAPLAWFGYLLYLSGFILSGVLTIYIAAALDILDGPIARELKNGNTKPPPGTLWEAVFYKGESELGGVIDASMDKIAIIPIYLHIAYSYLFAEFRNNQGDIYLVSVLLIIPILLADVVGGFIRSDPVYKLLKEIGFDVIKRANWIGKRKTLMQFMWLSLYLPAHQKWILPEYTDGYVWFLNGFLFVIFTFGTASVVTKLTKRNVNNT